MEKDTKKVVYEYLWSSLITFVLAFGAALAPTIGSVPVGKAALFGVIVAAARAGVRAVVNLIASGFQSASSRPQ